MFEVTTQKSTYFDELSVVQYGWDFDADQIGPSEEVSHARLYRNNHVGLTRFRYGAPYDQRLRARENILSFGLLDSDNPATWSYDQLIPNDALVIFPHDDKLRAVTPVGFRGYGLHFSESYLRNLAELVYRRPLDVLVPASGICPLNVYQLTSLRTEMSAWQQLATCSS